MPLKKKTKRGESSKTGNSPPASSPQINADSLTEDNNNSMDSSAQEKASTSDSRTDGRSYTLDSVTGDVTFTIGSNNEGRAQSSDYNKEGKPYAVFPVHSLVLCINSVYFKSLILNSGMKETTEKDIIIKVNFGKGKYLVLLINSFYDPDILSSLKVFDLLQLLEVADMFLSDPIIIHGLHLLKRMKVSSVYSWHLILEHMQKFHCMGTVPTTETYTILTHTCSDFLVKTFHCLESNLERHGVFNEMSLICLMMLLISKKPFLFHENSLVHFILSWLSADVDRQTDENIKILLNECCYEQMSPEYLTKFLTPNHPIFSIWKGWSGWHYKAVCHHALTKSITIFPEINVRQGHIFKDNSRMEQCVIQFSYKIGNDALKQWMSHYKNVIFEGCILSPELVINKSDFDKYDVMLHMYLDVFCKESGFEMFYLQCDVAFAIFPYAGCYSRNLFTNSDFVTQHFRRTRLIFHKNNLVTFSAGTVDEALFAKFMVDGIYVALAFKSCEKQWPTFGKTFTLTSSWPESPLDRKLNMYILP